VDRQRLFGLLAALVAVPFLALLMLGGGGGGGRALLPVLVVIAVIAFGASRVGRRTSEVSWTPPMAALDDMRISPSTVPARGSVAAALSRVEAGHLATSTWFVVGIGFWIVIIAMFGIFFVDEMEPTWWGVFSFVPLMAHPLCGCTIVATHRAMTRGRRDGAEELFSTCPAGWAPRTRGHLLTLWVPVIASTVLAGTLLVLVATRNPFVMGPLDDRTAIDFAIGVLLPAGAAALGVALGRWAPWALVPFVAVVLVAAADGRIGNIGDQAWESDRWLATFSTSTNAEILFFDPPGWERVLWFGGLVAVVAAIALLRGEHSRRVPALLGAGVVASMLAAVLVVRPLSEAAAAERADLINRPSVHQTCTPVDELVQVCVYDDLADIGPKLVDHLAPVAAAIPSAAREPVTFRHTLNGDVGNLQPEVIRLVTAPEGDDPDALMLRFYVQEESFEAMRLRLAAHATGLPTEPINDTYGHVVAGDAVGVVVLWLATRGMDEGDVRGLLEVGQEQGADVTPAMRGDAWPGRCVGEGPVLLWSHQDLIAARELVAADPAVVAAELASDWDRWTDPTTTTDELMVAVDLEPVGPHDDVGSFVDGCY
jgi:hypothetical protein